MILLLFSLSGYFSLNSPPSEPPNVDPLIPNVYVNSPLEITTTLAAIKTYRNIVSSRSFRILVTAAATIGLVVAAFPIFRGDFMPAILHILACFLLYWGFIVPSGKTLQVKSYSPTHNWDYYMSDLYSEPLTVPGVPIFMYLGLETVGYLTEVFTHAIDALGYYATGIHYKAYPYLIGDAITALLESELGNTDYVRVFERYTKECIAPAISKLYSKNENIPPDINALMDVLDTLRISDPVTKKVTTCNAYWNTWKTLLHMDITRMYQSLEAEADTKGTGEKREEILKYLGATEYIVGPAADVTDMLTGVTASKLIANALSNYTNFAEHTNPDRNIFYRGFSKAIGSLAEWSTSLFGNTIGDTIWRLFPYFAAISIALAYISFPVILVFAFIPGFRNILIDYFRVLIWVHSFLPFSVLVTQITNSFVHLNYVSNIIANLTKGVLDLGTIQRLGVTGAVATGVGGLLIITVPIFSYILIARGSFSAIVGGIANAGGFVATQAYSAFRTVSRASSTATHTITRRSK